MEYESPKREALATATSCCSLQEKDAVKLEYQERTWPEVEEMRRQKQYLSEWAAGALSRSSLQPWSCCCSAIAYGLGCQAKVGRQGVVAWHGQHSLASTAECLVDKHFLSLPSWLVRDHHDTPRADCATVHSKYQNLSALALSFEEMQEGTCQWVGLTDWHQFLIVDDSLVPAVHLAHFVGAHEMAWPLTLTYQVEARPRRCYWRCLS